MMSDEERENAHAQREPLRNENGDGKQIWYWEDAVRSQCGRARKWRYEVQRGDSVRETGTCPQGYKWWEMTISGTPTQISSYRSGCSCWSTIDRTLTPDPRQTYGLNSPN